MVVSTSKLSSQDSLFQRLQGVALLSGFLRDAKADGHFLPKPEKAQWEAYHLPLQDLVIFISAAI